MLLYGSEARGEGTRDSDIDVLVLLSSSVHLWEDLRTALKAVYPLSLRLARPISPKPVDVQLFEQGQYPLYARARDEGVQL